MRPEWKFYHPAMTLEHLGYLPEMLDMRDPRPAREQFGSAYVGGWRPFPGHIGGTGFKQVGERPAGLKYPGDPIMPALASCELRDELITFHSGSWVCVTQPDGTFEVARMD